MIYKVYTKEHDEIIRVSDLPEMSTMSDDSQHELKVLMKQWDAFNQEHTQDLVVNADDLASLNPDTPVTFLLDVSGSMRGMPARTQMATMRVLGDALTQHGVPFRVLGHTTSEWKGGMPRQDWISDGHPNSPGRLNSLRHIIFHDVGEDWDANKVGLGIMVSRPSLWKENIDGEAVAWAGSFENPGRIVYLTDGPPIDDSTLSRNPVTILTNHLNTVVSDLIQAGVEIVTVHLQTGTYSWSKENKRTAFEKFKEGYVDGAVVMDVEVEGHAYRTDMQPFLDALTQAASRPLRDLMPSSPSDDLAF